MVDGSVPSALPDRQGAGIDVKALWDELNILLSDHASAHPDTAADTDRCWSQTAAERLLAVVVQLCAWLLALPETERGVSAAAVQHRLMALLLNGGCVPAAVNAATAACRFRVAGTLASHVSRSVQGRSNPATLPSLALAMRALRVLCRGGGDSASSGCGSAAVPLSASCLQTRGGRDRLRMQVMDPSTCCQTHASAETPAVAVVAALQEAAAVQRGFAAIRQRLHPVLQCSCAVHKLVCMAPPLHSRDAGVSAKHGPPGRACHD